MALLWNQAAGSINLEFISYWNSGVLAAPDNHLTHEERSALQKLWGGLETGDVTIIGRSDEVHDFTSALINEAAPGTAGTEVAVVLKIGGAA